MPVETSDTPSAKPLYANKRVLYGVFGSVAIGVFTNFFTDFIKDYFKNRQYSQDAVSLADLQEQLDTIVKCRASFEYYVSFLSSQLFEGLVVVILSLLIIMLILVSSSFYGIRFEGYSVKSASQLSIKTVTSLCALVMLCVMAISGGYTSLACFAKALRVSDYMLEYDKSVSNLQNEIETLKRRAKPPEH